ncbi:MAG: multiubiquitin domain-containing protein [Janthinobacterium lividum]
MLIKLADRGATSIGLEETLDVVPGRRPVFRTFTSDRVYSFTVNELGWEWGAASIGEADIRHYAGIPEDHEIFSDDDPDTAISRGGELRLSDRGVEHFRSRKAVSKTVEIVVNGRDREVPRGDITFEKVIAIAFPDKPTGPNVAFTVTYRKGPHERPEGSLIAGQSVHVREGMVFNATCTDKS